MRLPANLAREADLREGDTVLINRTKNGLRVEKRFGSRLEARLATVLEPEEEVGAGRSIGAETAE